MLENYEQEEEQDYFDDSDDEQPIALRPVYPVPPVNQRQPNIVQNNNNRSTSNARPQVNGVRRLQLSLPQYTDVRDIAE